MSKYILAFLLAAVVSCVMTPVAKRIACKLGAIDVPKDERRVHKIPIPRMGGLAIYLGFVVSVLVSLPVDKKMSGMLIGATLIVLMGLIDDIRPLPAKVKLVGQIFCAFVLVYCGLRIEMVNVPFIGRAIYFNFVVSVPVTIFWIVGITNTLNLIDGLDGLAAGVATIAAFSLSYVAYVNEQYGAALMTLAIAGSAVGFLPHNFNPAKIFMGDTGSLFLGYMLAAISIDGAVKGAAALAIVVPVLALGLPIFDTTFAIVRRAWNGRPIMEPDKGHLHHRLLSRGIGQKKTVLILYIISAALGVSAALISEDKFLDSVLVLLLVSLLMMYIMKGSVLQRDRESHSQKE